jgi:hypothetical protein
MQAAVYVCEIEAESDELCCFRTRIYTRCTVDLLADVLLITWAYRLNNDTAHGVIISKIMTRLVNILNSCNF